MFDQTETETGFETVNGEHRSIYVIPAENIEKFETQVKKLSRRAEKLGFDPIIPFIFDRINKKVKGVTRRFYKVYFTAINPKIEGWKFVATLDHSSETGNIVRSVPNSGVEIPVRFRTAEPNCEHCKVRRYRRDTLIVCNDTTGEFTQVGSTCLADFLGHDAYKIARNAEFLSYADECARAAEQDLVGGDLRYICLESFLGHAAAACRIDGWVSGKAAYENPSLRATKMWAYLNMTAPKAEDRHPVTDADRALAAEALEWARGFSEKTNPSEYEFNVMVIAGSEVIEFRSIGIAASIVGVYLRHKGELAARTVRVKTVSEFVGKEGDKLDFGTCAVVGYTITESRYGATYLYTFKDEAGNKLKWFASKSQGIQQGDTVTLSGTVKKFDTYKDEKQTLITRCKVAKIALAQAA